MQRSKLSRSSIVLASAPCLMLSANASAQTTVFMDYSDFDTRLGELAVGAGVTAFSAAEITSIKASIKSKLETAYSAFTISFTETSPGGAFPTLDFGPLGGGYGVATHIDYRNKAAADLASVFTANFDDFIDEFSGSTSRATQLSQLSTALAGTAAHELGHNFGLRHHDAYAVSSLTYTGLAPIATGGAQNVSIMATGSTGLSEAEREVDRSFSDHSMVKLSYAADLNASIPASVAEGSDYGDTTGTATGISFTALSAISKFATNIVGTIGTGSDHDVFSFDLLAGSEFTADVNIDFPVGSVFTNVNTYIELIGPDGFSVLAADDVSAYGGDTFGIGPSGDGFDPMMFNVDILVAGKYYLRIAPESGAAGDYELLMYTNMMDDPLIPLPSGAALAMAGLVLVGVRRRRN